jgi:ZIP family zinc transporter
MSEFLQVLALAVAPVGAVAGGLLAEWLDVSRWRLSLALHAAAGILLGIVAVELLPEALRAESRVAIFLAFALGGGAFILADRGIDAAAARFGGDAGAADPG